MAGEIRLVGPVVGQQGSDGAHGLVGQRDHGDIDAAPLRQAATSGDADGLMAQCDALLCRVPYPRYANRPMAKYEGWYAGLIYSYLTGAGYETPVESCANHGRPDLAQPSPGIAWIFAFKVAGHGGGSALAQIKTRGCADKYRDGRRRIMLVGIEFDEAGRYLVSIEVEEVR